MLNKVGLLAVFGFTLLMGSAAVADQAALLERGQEVYSMQCARCHGPQGKGDGMDAKRLPDAPRDLVEGAFKFKSTAYGTPPSDEDLMWVLNHGMAGGGMPSFANLSLDAKESLIAYIKSISQAWGEYEPEPLPAPNTSVKVNLATGRAVFEKLQCELCHGAGGRANGPQAAGLAVPPADLTQGWQYRAGSDPIQVYYRLMAGIEGAGMPSFKDVVDSGAISQNDVWQLANYVTSLQLEANWDLTIVAHEISGALPTAFEDPRWDEATRTDIIMQSAVYRYGRREETTVDAVHVKALFSESDVAFRVFWNDPTENREGSVDALLMALKPESLKGDVRDNLYTLYNPTQDTLDLVKWQASQPNAVGQRQSSLDDASRPGWRGEKELRASAQYQDGIWTLVFHRPLKPGDHELVGFAAWDGGKKERRQRRSTSQWIALAFGKAPTTTNLGCSSCSDPRVSFVAGHVGFLY